MTMRSSSFTVVMLVSSLLSNLQSEEMKEFAPDVNGYQQIISPFLKRHCLECHGPDLQEADFRVDQLSNDFQTLATARKWSQMLDMLNGGEMPPKDEPRPPLDKVAEVSDWISQERLRGEKARQGRTIVLRRLNRVEYNNTVRDLLGVDMQPAAEFPADPPAGGFDNNGGVLSISPLQLELYMKAARQVLDRAIVTDQQRPPVIKWRFQLEDGNQGLDRYRVTVGDQRILVNGGNNLFRNGMTVLRRQQWDSPANVRDFRVPYPGDYILRVRAAGLTPAEEIVRQAGPRFYEQRQQRNDAKLTDKEELRRSREHFEKWVRPYVQKHFLEDRRYQFGPPRIKLTSYLGGGNRVLGEFEVSAPESAPAIYEVRAWFEPVEAGIFAENVYHIPHHDYNFWFQGHDEFPRPELLIDWLELEGPYYDSWPPSSHRQILIESPNKGIDEERYARDVLAHFMRRAYRRPLRDGEVNAKLLLFRQARLTHASFQEAIKVPLIAVLSSPHFLYMVEENRTAAGQTDSDPLDNFEFATRLSYFLWSTLPDDVLVRLAEQDELVHSRTLVHQVDRMLADPRSEQLVRNFAGQWLRLRDVGANPPAKNIFPEYDNHLEVSIRGESEAFFAHILNNDLNVLNFIRSDFVTINERLARFYGIPGVRGDHFRVVKVPERVHRGGLVTQASVLTVTSNGTRTSPVARGVWILERLLGTPPPPPPANAGDIPPAASGLPTTVRERLRIHREQPQCARCHNRIDPLGFALENYNGAGEWREREAKQNEYEAGLNDPPIDARAKLPDGTEFLGVEGLQQELLKRQDQFLKCLAEKLYVYALGRELGYADQPTIENAVQHMKQNRYTLRSLIQYIVSSELFRSK